MDRDVSLLYPAGYSREKKEKNRLRDMEFVESLSLRSMIVITNETFRGVPAVRLTDFFTTDPEVISYRLDLLEELLDNGSLLEMFENALPLIRGIFDMHTSLNGSYTIDKALSVIRILESYVQVTDIFYESLSDADLHSEGLKRLKESIEATVCSDEYRNLKKDMESETVDFSSLQSVTIGVNLDANLQAEEAGLVSVNTERFHKGTLIGKVTGKDKDDPYVMLSTLYPMPKGWTTESLGLAAGSEKNPDMKDTEIDAAVLEKSVRHALEDIYRNAIRAFGPVVEKYFSVNTSAYVTMFPEIRFLLAEVKFINDMRDAGFVMSKPTVCEISDKCIDLKEVYNVNLARSRVEENLVLNDFKTDDNGRFFILTGPNHGGKSVFLRAVGTAQALFQLGCYIPATEGKLSPVRGIYTHFAAAEAAGFGRGRFESECEKLVKILRKLTGDDMLLMDESFSGTSAMEAAYIAEEVITGIGAIGACGIFVTHIHDLSEKLDTFNSYPDNKAKIDNLAAMMEDKENGIRSYRIKRVKPDGSSYARDIAAKCGLNFTDRGSFG